MTVALLVVAAAAAFAAALVFSINLALKSSDAYRVGVARASSAPEVVALLGEPVVAGYFVRGGVRGGGRSARLRVPLSGPRGSGTLELRAAGAGAGLRFDVLRFHAAGRVVDLLGGGPAMR